MKSGGRWSTSWDLVVTDMMIDQQPAVVVIDSIRMLRDFVAEAEIRAALYDLTSRIGHTETALLAVGEYTTAEIENSGAELALADGIIPLAYEARVPVDRHWLRVVARWACTNSASTTTASRSAISWTTSPASSAGPSYANWTPTAARPAVRTASRKLPARSVLTDRAALVLSPAPMLPAWNRSGAPRRLPC